MRGAPKEAYECARLLERKPTFTGFLLLLQGVHSQAAIGLYAL